MAKKKDLFSIVGIIVSMIVGIGVGGLFIDGGFLNVMGLKLLPLIVHQIVGWIVVVGAALEGGTKLMK